MVYPVDLSECYLREPFGTTEGREIPHTGDDFARRKGAPAAPRVMARASGVVIASSWHGNAGNRIVVEYDDGDLWGTYAHLAKRLVAVDDRVEAGETIGLLGATGKVTGPHLHYSINTSRERALGGIYPYFLKTGLTVGQWMARADVVDPAPFYLAKSATKTEAPAPDPDPAQEPTMYRISDVTNGGKVYLVTDRGMVHIRTPQHNALFDRMLGVTVDGKRVADPQRGMNDLEVATIAGYIAAAGHSDRAAIDAAVRQAVAGLELGDDIADQVVDGIAERLAPRAA
jgi:hypothetical protein